MRGNNHDEKEELPLTETLLEHYEQLYQASTDKNVLNNSDTIYETNESLIKNATNETLKIINNEIIEKEVKNAIAKLKNIKAPGFDGITNEMIMGSPSALNIPASLFNLILSSGHFPSQWNFGLIKNIHKGGNNDDPNYSALSSMKKLSKFCDHNNIIANEQEAFRKGYRATGHIYLL